MKPLDVKTIPIDTTVLIEASAGTGKTYTTGLLVLRLILEKNVPVEKIVLITFTDAAALELKKKTAEKILEAYNIWEKDDFKEDDDLNNIVKTAKNSENPQKIKVTLLDAIAHMDEMPVFTIHGFCKKLLEEFMFEMGNYEKREVVTNIDKIKEKAVAGFWRDNIKNWDVPIEIKPEDLSKAINEILNHPHAEKKGEMFDEKTLENLITSLSGDISDTRKKEVLKKIKYAVIYKMADGIYEKLQKEKRRLKVMYFSDMIEDCYNGVEKDKKNGNILRKAVQKKYDAIMVDEFQDTDRIQFEIFEYLFEDKPFFMIGDPKQAIYSFRGGDIFAYKEAREKAGENQYSMDTNYRSEKTLLDALNVFFTNKSFKNMNNNDTLMGDNIEYNKVKCGIKDASPLTEKDDKYKPFVIIRGNYEKDKNGNIIKIYKNFNKPDGKFRKKIKKAVISEIKRLLNTGNIEPKDIAILLDSNYDCIEYKNALTNEGIPSIVKGAAVFSSDAAFFLRIFMNAVCYNNNIRYIRALLTTRYCGYKPEEIDDKVFAQWSKIIYEAKVKWEENGIMNALEYFLTENDLWSRILKDINGERNITNIRQLIEILNEEEAASGRVPEKLNNRFASLCSKSANNEETEEKLETDDDALKIMTIHKSKGLQFNIVFAPNINRNPRHEFPEPYFYHNNENREIMAYFASDDKLKELNNKEEKEEAVRLLYVALTRAKYRLYASFLMPGKNSQNKPHGLVTSICRQIFDDFCNSGVNDPNIQIEELDNMLKCEYAYEKKEKIENENKTIKQFDVKIEPSWQMSSFSGISGKLQHPEFISVLHKDENEPPGGKRMGTILHSIFEDLEFDANEKEIQEMIERKLGGFKEFAVEGGEQKKEWIKEKVIAVLNKDLPHAGKLCRVNDNKAAELNFTMNSQNMKLEKIKDIMGEKITYFEQAGINAKFLNGAIDLIFLGKDNKYYILDWKSNTLNNYSKEAIDEDAMVPNGYHLQYYIYAVALKRWLEKTQKDFDFREQFGGVFYIFIRGVSNIEGNLDGIFFAKNNEIIEDIIKMDECFWRKDK